MADFIDKDKFQEIETGDKINTRFMGKCESLGVVIDGEVLVRFTHGPWKDRELKLIRQQISSINVIGR